MSDPAETTDTFSDAHGQDFIAGYPVDREVMRRHLAVFARMSRLEAALREFADLDERVWPNFVARAKAALEGGSR